jgi:hypothetical protein
MGSSLTAVGNISWFGKSCLDLLGFLFLYTSILLCFTIFSLYDPDEVYSRNASCILN